MADSHKAFRADGFQLSILASAVSELRTVLIGFHTTMMQQPKPKIIPQWSQCLNLYRHLTCGGYADPSSSNLFRGWML
jgi:hypothetical protein